MSTKKLLIKEHLLKYGLTDIKKNVYKAWAFNELSNKNISTSKIEKLFQLKKKMSNATYKEKCDFYKYVGKKKAFLDVIHSYKFNAISENCITVINDAKDFSNILDVGCNAGYLTSFYAQYFKFKHITGIDICIDSIKQAHRNYKKIRNLHFTNSYEKLPNNYYDLVVDTQCLSTINNKYVLRRTLRELYKKTKMYSKIISLSPFNSKLEIEEFINETKKIGFYIENISSIIYREFEYDEALTKLVLSKSNSKYNYNTEEYFSKVRKMIGLE